MLADSPVVIAGGEKVKSDNLQSALKVISAILSAKLGKNDVILAIGGGTILDVAGYAAAQVRGGVKIVRIPTTPAAMVDAAFADYAAVDSATVKDALRVASEPAAVIVDTNFATTVLDGVWRGGISDAIRHAVATDSALLKKILQLVPAYQARDMKALDEIVRTVHASRAKKGATTFGLWSALRLESMSGYKLPHGYAVAIGVCIGLEYAVEKGTIKSASRDSVVDALRTCGALDGISHSVHLLNQAENLLFGLDAWALSAGGPALVTLAGLGKSGLDESPDRELLKKVLKSVVSFPVQR